MFGIQKHLTLKDGCSRSTYLLENGVSASHIFAIRSNYLELLHEANTRGFQDGIRMLMHRSAAGRRPFVSIHLCLSFYPPSAIFTYESPTTLGRRRILDIAVAPAIGAAAVAPFLDDALSKLSYSAKVGHDLS